MASRSLRLTTTDHDRDLAGLRYVYPVLSRRSGGLSVGINLNPNNACNWRCIYCQVPNLRRGSAPEIDLARLRAELGEFLGDVLDGGFYERFEVAPERRIIRDIAISGNGEPTSAREFPEVVDTIGAVASEFGLSGRVALVLISNGSLLHRPAVSRAIARWAELGGELWFKIDSATEAGLALINQVRRKPAAVERNLAIAARNCPTWIQTCVFALDGQPPSEAEQTAYLDLLARCFRQGLPLRGVLLYGLARPSLQPEAPRLSALPVEWMERYAERIRVLGLHVKLSP